MYHPGELEAQERAGERTMGERNGRAISNRIPPGAIPFIEKQHFFFVSSKQANGELCASVVAGESGYLKVPDPGIIEVDTRLIISSPHDPFWNAIHTSARTGMLFIEPSTRRRYRVNGLLERDGDLLRISIDEAYPNCPKYVQQRHVSKAGKPVYTDAGLQGSALEPPILELIRQADTFFVGSASDMGDLDVSHRGGLPGFVSIEEDGSLLIPDYSGNSMFNTLGNFIQYPEAGLLFVDFSKQLTLQMAGRVEILWNHPDPQSSTGGTSRFWRFFPRHWLLLQNLKGYDWSFVDYSPFNPPLKG